MARNLPWKSSGSTVTKTVRKSKTPTAASRTKSKQKSTPEDGDRTTSGASRLGVPKKRARARSNSPGEGPEVEYMEEGLDHDDIYAMVEDEFFATAKKFTRHIHQAALDEMEKAAKMKSKETIAAVSRPTTTAMPAKTKRKLDGEARAKRQGEGVKKLLSKVPGADDTDDDPDAIPAWVGTSLHGLMEAPKKPPPSLARLGVLKVKKENTSQSSKITEPSSYSSQFAPQTKSNTTKQVSFVKIDDDETASDDEDEDDLDARPKAAKVVALPQAQTLKAEPKELPRTSIFLQSKPKPKLPSGSDMRSSLDLPPKLNRPVEVEETTETTKPPVTLTDSAEHGSRLAQIKRRLAERRRRLS